MSSLEKRLAQGKRLYADFQGENPHRYYRVTVDMPPIEVALVIGTLFDLTYKKYGDGELYTHQFERARPLLASSSDGHQLYILKGGYRFTKRGIVG